MKKKIAERIWEGAFDMDIKLNDDHTAVVAANAGTFAAAVGEAVHLAIATGEDYGAIIDATKAVQMDTVGNELIFH